MVSNLELQNKIAILLVSHGSSLPFAEVTFNEIKDKFNKATGFATEVGYMKVAEPSIAGAVENLKEEVPELEKIIAIPCDDPNYNQYKDISELPSHIFEEMKHFFSVYKTLENKKTEVNSIQGKEEALKIIYSTITAYNKKFK